MDLGYSYAVTKDLIDFVFIHQLGLIYGHGLFLCNALLLFLFGWLDEIFYFHGILKHAFFESAVHLALSLGEYVDAGPHLAKSSGPQLFFAKVFATDVFLGVIKMGVFTESTSARTRIFWDLIE